MKKSEDLRLLQQVVAAVPVTSTGPTVEKQRAVAAEAAALEAALRNAKREYQACLRSDQFGASNQWWSEMQRLKIMIAAQRSRADAGGNVKGQP